MELVLASRSLCLQTCFLSWYTVESGEAIKNFLLSEHKWLKVFNTLTYVLHKSATPLIPHLFAFFSAAHFKFTKNIKYLSVLNAYLYTGHL